MSEKLWGGRFSKGMDKLMEKFSESISYDYKLAEADIKCSVVHAKMLGKQGIIPDADSKKIVIGLEDILYDLKAGKIEFDSAFED
ncbi:MAG: argininosuccinate lyase, partial [Armatimonadetes bacterium]|nr:argininosuccinate lyase [Candidatus Hippobium faecium]